MSEQRDGTDPVRRLHVMAAGVRGARVAEHVVPAPFEEVWPVMAALDFLPDLARIRVLGVDGDRIEAVARSRYGFRAHLRGYRRPGWCWMQSRFLIVGLAAVPAPGTDGPATLVALTGGVRVPGRAAVLPFGTLRELHTATRRLEDRMRVRAARPGG
ncbi:hypothetical protein AMK16_12240 [Streptomyces sp. CB00455]|uniref:hypothetical protein n=1 Tax=Streptomyces sp. CB00455 TaxID=1703927 RepID=UPI00093FEE3E|nr:hypothetical protein [Streptomyces sp. CB00455]OKK21266.1 hypothetical protein AMK16_12240 [Streptomyces sp. CB00455]